MSEFKFEQFDTIGAAAAEDDDFLSDSFVDTGHLTVLSNISDPRRILLGRTGSGKSALIRRLMETQERVIRVEPETLALEHISNSTILRFLADLDVRLDIFFKLLWRHVLVVELIKKKIKLTNQSTTDNWFSRIFRSKEEKEFRDALEYLKKWGEKFWESTDYRIKEITTRFEDDIKASIGGSIQTLDASIGASKTMSEEQRLEVTQRSQKIVNQIQIRELSSVIKLIDRLLDDSQKSYFICIDRLDEEWIDDELRYRLIRALIETSRDFGSVKRAKIVVAIRQDLLQKVYDVTRDGGFQEEKYESLYLNVTWSRRQLVSLMDRRVGVLVSRRYTKRPVVLKDVVPKTMGRSGESPIDYIIDRTLLRPRDAIAYLNCAIPMADGKKSLTATVIRQAEADYSHSRLKAIFDEWHANHPDLSIAVRLLHRRPPRFRVQDIEDSQVENICIELCSESSVSGALYDLAVQIYEDNATLERWRRRFVLEAYKVGIVGLQFPGSGKIIYSYDGRRRPPSLVIDDDTVVSIHPAFHVALMVQQRKKSPRKR